MNRLLRPLKLLQSAVAERWAPTRLTYTVVVERSYFIDPPRRRRSCFCHGSVNATKIKCRRSLSSSAAIFVRDGDKRKDAKNYVTENPELENVLRDLYDDPETPGQDSSDKKEGSEERLPLEKFDVFQDSSAKVIYDIDEEMAILRQRESDELTAEKGLFHPAQPEVDPKFAQVTRSRGECGVFDVDELVSLLRRENCQDVCVLKVSPQKQYVDQIVIVTCKSLRRMVAVSSFLRKAYKMKMKKGDVVPNVEGLNTDANWFAMDLGNIALHLFLEESRKHYDIESLWAVGSAFDEKSTEKEDDEDNSELEDSLFGLSPAVEPGSKETVDDVR